jgi:hypothetical protein
MDVFRAEKVAAVDDQSTKVCRFCSDRLHLRRSVIDSDTGDFFHMFECDCGERVWSD